MTQTLIEMKDLYSRLTTVGVSKIFVREKVLPDWWDDEFEDTPGAVTQAASYISRRLNLDLDSLLEPDRQPTLKLSCQPRFKTQQGQDSGQVSIAHCLTTRIAELVAYACKPSYRPLDDMSIADIRHEILHQHPFVHLDSILEFCWSRGIPVLHFADFPSVKGSRKFDGMVTEFGTRPVVVISLNHRSPARLLFIVAHEVGHIYKKHIESGLLVDEVIAFESRDSEEVEANEVAVELLLGKPDISYDTRQPFLTEEKIIEIAQSISVRDHIDPGVVTLNFAWNKANRATTKEDKKIVWATASKALKIIEKDISAPERINSYLMKNLDWGRLSNDNQEYLATIMGFQIGGINA